jgi:hypothetical protein
MNQQVLGNLDRVISTLDNDGDPGAAEPEASDAG